MILQRTEHPDWLSNAYVLADKPGGSGVLIDGNGVTAPLLELVERERLTITHILCTHDHADHVAGLNEYRARFGAPILAHELAARSLGPGAVDRTLADGDELQVGALRVRALHTPGHSPGHLAFLTGDRDGDATDCFTADVLFQGTVGGTSGPGGNYPELKRSVLKVLTLPGSTRVHPGHREPTTVEAELASNPFVRIWRGVDLEGSVPCRVRVRGRDATLVLWADDYDGGHKAWVRYPDGEDAIVGGSQVERPGGKLPAR